MSSRSYDRGYDRGYTTRAPRQKAPDRPEEYRTKNGRGIAYYYGSAAPALEDASYRTERQDTRRRQQARSSASAKPAGRRSYMTPALIAFMTAGLCVMAACFFTSITLTTRITNAVEEIADLESELSELRKDNDEALNVIESSISLDDIKYRAITELGMSYADEDQIVHYSNEESDYVRQVIQPE